MKIDSVRKLALWIFILPFVSVNLCLIIVQSFQEFLAAGDGIGKTFPYFDGGTSISRTARVFPTYLIFKPAMFVTSFLLIKYWLLNKEIIASYLPNEKNVKIFLIMGILSAVSLTLHSIFLGIKFDYSIYKFFRRFIMLSFIIFELVAQVYLVICLYKIRLKISNFVNYSVLKIKIALVSVLSIVAIISLPIVTTSGNKIFKHALEWDFFLGIILFYMLTFLMWKKQS